MFKWLICSDPEVSGRTALLYLAELCLIYIIVAGTLSYFAPDGYWINHVFGIKIGVDVDPGGPYFISSINFLEHKFILNGGHPGIPLQYWSHGVLFFYNLFCNHAKDSQDFTFFVLKHIATSLFLVKLSITVLHAISFFLLFFFARKLVGNDRVAFLAVLGYATSYLVLYYLSKISVEPQMVSCFMLTWLLLWKYEDSLKTGDNVRAYLYAAAAGVISLTGVFVKLNLMAIFPLYCLVFLIWGPRQTDGEKSYPGLKHKVTAALLFTAAAVGVFFFWNQHIDWQKYFRFWFYFAPGEVKYDSGQSVLLNLKTALASIPPVAFSIVKNFLLRCFWYLRLVNRGGVFFICEWLYLLLGLWGLILFFKLNPTGRRNFLWVGVFLITNLMASSYHLQYNYFYNLYVFMAPYFAWILSYFVQRFVSVSERHRFLLMACLILLIHHVAIWACLNSRVTDIGLYRRNIRPYFLTLSRMNPGERAVVLTASPKDAEIDKELEKKYTVSYRFVDESAKAVQLLQSDLFIQISRERLLESADSAMSIIDSLRSVGVKYVVDDCGNLDAAGETITKGPFGLKEWADEFMSK